MFQAQALVNVSERKAVEMLKELKIGLAVKRKEIPTYRDAPKKLGTDRRAAQGLRNHRKLIYSGFIRDLEFPHNGLFVSGMSLAQFLFRTDGSDLSYQKITESKNVTRKYLFENH